MTYNKIEYNEELKGLLNNILSAAQACETPLRRYIDLQITTIHRIGLEMEHDDLDNDQELYRLRLEE